MGKSVRSNAASRPGRIGWLRLPFVLVPLLVALAAGVPPVLAAKTDMVRLDTGDVLTGEVKSMERGQLTYKTDTMETVSIKWSHVVRLTSPSWFLVTVEGGVQHYGRFAGADTDGMLRVDFVNQFTDLTMTDIVRIEPIESKLWDRVSLALSAGLSYTQASEVTQITLDGKIGYRDRRHLLGLDASTILTDKGDGSERSQQFDSALNYQHTLTGRLFGAATISGERNDELGLDLRLLAGVGAGYRLIESDASDLTLVGGISTNREWSTGDETPTNNVEALLNSSYSLYFYETPKTDIDISGTFFQTIDSDRQRAQLDVSARRELIKDFFVALSYYESYDSQPPSAEGDKTDHGVVLQISWSK